MPPAGFFVLFLPGRGFWTGRGWSADEERAKKWAGPGRPYTSAARAAARLAGRLGRAPLIAYLPRAKIPSAEIPDSPPPRSPRRKD